MDRAALIAALAEGLLAPADVSGARAPAEGRVIEADTQDNAEDAGAPAPVAVH